MSTRRRGARQAQHRSAELPTSDSDVSQVAPMPDHNSGVVLVKRVFNYLLLTGAVAGLLYVYYAHFLFDALASVSLDADGANQAFVVVDLPGRGKGALATRDIAVSY
ncbi:hypothetical protein EIP91_003997 [Steccherinum ochraceum]|uniref:Uncharacterized protein n=1 Tax=Steccherinum ochraceum TaxID=92696 RepID=A0A4R0R9L7_9APHY|nr:hypothetical protein EIP91_003997 [Steccherinum ochraceum]